MIIQILTFLIFSSSIVNSSSVIFSNHLDLYSSVIDEILILMLEKCNLGIKNIVFYDQTGSSLATSVLKVQSSIGVILETTLKNVKRRDTVEIDGFIVVINSDEEWETLIPLIILHWTCTKSCTVIILSKEPKSCQYVEHIFQKMTFAQYNLVYFLCDDPRKGPVIYTHDLYGDTEPTKWQKQEQNVSSLYPRSGYYRLYDRDLCQDFNFDRTNPQNNMQIMMGLGNSYGTHAGLKYYLSTNSTIISKTAMANVISLEQLLNTKFTLVGVYEGSNNSMPYLLQTLWQELPIDFYFRSMTIEDYFETCPYTNSYAERRLIIISHVPSLVSPLEKIARYYGIWVLISLIIVLSMTFIVIFMKTRRNLALAVFDTLRLLLEWEIITPIDTLPLKIFFSMIFMYFLVIHATFHGNLSKFLTIPQFHYVIDSVKDLATSRIVNIYTDQMIVNHIEGLGEINKRITSLPTPVGAFKKYQADRRSVWITTTTAKEHVFEALEYQNQYYQSKKAIGQVRLAAPIRSRSFFGEKLKWAVTYLYDTRILGYKSSLSHNKMQIRLLKNLVNLPSGFRKVSIKDLQFAFILLIIGNILGLISFSIEFATKKYYKYKNKLTIRKVMGLSNKIETTRIGENQCQIMLDDKI